MRGGGGYHNHIYGPFIFLNNLCLVTDNVLKSHTKF